MGRLCDFETANCKIHIIEIPKYVLHNTVTETLLWIPYYVYGNYIMENVKNRYQGSM